MSSSPFPRTQTGDVTRRTFRKSKWRHIVRPALASAMVLIFFIFVTLLAYELGFPWFVVVGFFVPVCPSSLFILDRIFEWGAWSLVAQQGGRKLVLFEGLVRMKETEIPLSDFATVSVEQDWWDRRLDVGRVTINAMGGPFVFPDIEDFEDFRQVLRTYCAFVPQRRPNPFFANMRGVISRLVAVGGALRNEGRQARNWVWSRARVVAHSLTILVRSAWRCLYPICRFPIHFFHQRTSHPSLHRIPQSSTAPLHVFANSTKWITLPRFRGDPFDRSIITAVGCWAFADEFLFRRHDWSSNNCCASDPSREYYQDGLPRRVVYAYLNKLRHAGVLVIGPGGRERISARVRSIDDVIRCTQPLFENVQPAGSLNCGSENGSWIG